MSMNVYTICNCTTHKLCTHGWSPWLVRSIMKSSQTTTNWKIPKQRICMADIFYRTISYTNSKLARASLYYFVTVIITVYVCFVVVLVYIY